MSTIHCDEEFLREAIRLSVEKMDEDQSGPFGAVVVRDGEIIGRGWNQVTSTNDPTAHAEIVAIRDACGRIGSFSLAGCTIYTSCHPCPMCLAAIYWARIERICYAASCADAAEAGFDDAWIFEELARSPETRRIPVQQGLRDEAIAAFEAWRAKADRTPY